MKAVKFHGANLRLTPPKDWDEAKNGKCLTIYGHRANGQVTTIWEPTDAERVRIAAGANIAMVVAGSTIMPAMMIVADIKAVPEEV
jgi:hypothetical protein